MLWIVLVLIYGIIKGMREVLKKKALERNTTLEVLLLYTFLSFLIVTPEIRNAGGVDPKVLLMIAVKSLAIFYAWRCGFTALAKLPVSLYGVLDLSRVVFSTLLGVIVLHETMGVNQTIGLILVLTGLLLLKGFRLPHRRTRKILSEDISIKNLNSQDNPDDQTEHNNLLRNTDPASNTQNAKSVDADIKRSSAVFIILAFISCLLNAVSGLFDKLLMSYTDITDGQLQFWYMLFLVIFYMLYALIRTVSARRQCTSGKGNPEKSADFHIDWKSAIKNYWIWILAVLFVIADRCLFIANSDPASKVTIMTLLKQSGVIFAIICGKFMFHEKKTGYRLVCALIILTGIFISVL
ncbi:MAG: EamA family transporter [Lachnospiraceae bacterium]|nr:EamA family transporter [Lachnospiraceae bacterium]